VKVNAALNEVMKRRTTFVIAHRLATVRNATRILVLDHGCIVKSGTFDELVGKGGVFAALAKAQFIAGEPERTGSTTWVTPQPIEWPARREISAERQIATAPRQPYNHRVRAKLSSACSVMNMMMTDRAGFGFQNCEALHRPRRRFRGRELPRFAQALRPSHAWQSEIGCRYPYQGLQAHRVSNF
jgi:hypothetical protein